MAASKSFRRYLYFLMFWTVSALSCSISCVWLNYELRDFGMISRLLKWPDGLFVWELFQLLKQSPAHSFISVVSDPKILRFVCKLLLFCANSMSLNVTTSQEDAESVCFFVRLFVCLYNFVPSVRWLHVLSYVSHLKSFGCFILKFCRTAGLTRPSRSWDSRIVFSFCSCLPSFFVVRHTSHLDVP